MKCTVRTVMMLVFNHTDITMHEAQLPLNPIKILYDCFVFNKEPLKGLRTPVASRVSINGVSYS